MRCFITGVAGFIGSHLLDLLIASGHEVIGVDNLSNGHLKNIEHLLNHPRFSFFECDILDREKLQEVFVDIDVVFHLAALADLVPSIENPQGYYDSNVTGTFNVLELSRKAKVKKFLYAASCSCYGLAKTFPTPENAPIEPQYPYALTKYMGEQLVLHWHQVYKMPVVSLRLFNVFGPRSRTTGTYGAVFGVFLAQKLNNKPFTIVGDGKQTRDFTYVTDVADAFYVAALSDQSGEVFNVGSGGHYSVNRLVELLQGPTTHIPKRPGEPDCTFGDIKKIKRLLDWTPKTSFEQGVQNILDHKDYWKDAPLWDPESIEGATKSWFQYLGSK